MSKSTEAASRIDGSPNRRQRLAAERTVDAGGCLRTFDGSPNRRQRLAAERTVDAGGCLRTFAAERTVDAGGCLRTFAWPPQIRRLGDVAHVESAPQAPWCFAEVAGRLVELCDEHSCAALTFAVRLVLDAQRARENVVWITARESSFYPPDVAEWGVDLDALAVVRLADAREIAGAADALARSGAFGLLVLDLGAGGDVSSAVQTRLLGLAQKHDAAIVCLTIKSRERPSLGSLFSLRGQASRRACGAGRFECELLIVKDKRGVKDKRRSPDTRSGGRRYSEVCRGPHGLC